MFSHIYYKNNKYKIILYNKILFNKMNIDINEYNKIKLINEELLIKNKELEDKLKSYTNNNRHKKYYENNSNVVKERAKKYMEKIKESNPEKIKEWSRNAYLNKKLKLQKEQKEQKEQNKIINEN